MAFLFANADQSFCQSRQASRLWRHCQKKYKRAHRGTLSVDATTHQTQQDFDLGPTRHQQRPTRTGNRRPKTKTTQTVAVKALSSASTRLLNRPHWPERMSTCEDGFFCIVLTSVFGVD